jgi:hypothetical protein
MEIEAQLNLSTLPEFLERYGLHFNPVRPSRRGLRFVNAFEDPEAPNTHVSIFKTLGGATMTLKTDGGFDCVVEIDAGEDGFVTWLLEREARKLNLC